MPPKRDRFRNRRGRGGSGRPRPTGPPAKKEYRHQDQLTETEVGITEFLSELEGFSGIIKARFSDFHVSEINLEGVVAKLTDTSIPKDFVSKAEKIDFNSVATTPLEKIQQDKWDALKNLVSVENAELVRIEAEDLNKDDRREIHKCVKTHFGQKIVASTVTIDDKKYLLFRKYDKKEKPDERFHWPEDKGEYVHFLVYKEGIDTMEACLKISDCLRISPSKFTYAGVKDKRSKSTQWFSVHKVEPWKLVMKTKSIQKVKVGNFTFKTEPLKLGQLSGNKFRIALRNVLGEDSLINQAMKQLKDNGFINYYGLQRFGNDKEVPTYEIGINLLLGKWKEAVQLILKPKTSDDPDSEVAKAKKIYFETEDVDKACEALDNGNSKCVEVRLLRGLKKENRNDFVNALENIPRNMRLLYIHSLQSFVWNSMVSKRLQVFGGKPVEGDFVLVDTKVEQTDEIRLDVEEDKEDEDCFMNKQEIKALTSEELPNYTIYDIVLPLPGYDVNYPEPMKQYYVEALEEHGLTLEMTKQKVKTYTLSGNYRKMLAKVNDLSWKIMRYDDPNENLIRSDFEELKGHPEPKGVKDGQYKALVMEFCLPPSSYATMVLREILKSDTSSSAQARQNDYHETQPSKKIIIESEQEQNEDKSEECCDGVQTNSLLSDAKKYEAFKNSIFNSVEVPKEKVEERVDKRKNEESDESSKRQRVEDAEQTRIVMDTPVL